MRLPVIRSARDHVVAAVATVLLCGAMYLIPQHWNFAAPIELPLTRIDRAIPFWPSSGLIYFGAFIFLLATPPMGSTCPVSKTLSSFCCRK